MSASLNLSDSGFVHGHRIDLTVTGARVDFYARAWWTPAYVAYIREHGLDIEVMTPAVGATGVLPIIDYGHGRFDFGPIDGDLLAFVCEAIGEDGESTEDLIAWPVNDPRHVLTMLGRAGIVGMWEAMNPATYYLDKPLVMHRTPLDWLKARCRGAAIADKRVAAWQFLDLPGRVAGRDQAHGRELLEIAEQVVDRSRFIAAAEAQNIREAA